MHGSHSLAKIGQTNVYVGLHWFYTNAKHPLLDPISLRDIASKEGVHFYAQNKFTTTVGDTGKEKTLRQYALVPSNKLEDKEILCGASLVSQYSLSAGLLQQGITTAFIYSMPNEDSKNPAVWVFAMNESGGIIEGQDVLCSSESKALSLLDDLSLTDQIEFIIDESDEVARKIATVFLTNIEGELDDSKIRTLTTNALIDSAPESSASIKRAYRPLPFKIEKAAIYGVAGAALVAVYFGVTYSSMASYEEVLEEAAPFVDQKMSQYNQMMGEYRASNFYDEHSFRTDTLEQFSQSLQQTLYDPLTIALVLREINSTLPMNAAQWELTKISYVNNRFLVFYNRRPKGKGVYFLLDENIAAVNQSTNNIRVTPFSLNDEGNTRVYSIAPVASVARQELINKTKDGITIESKLRNDVGRAIQEASRHLRDISDNLRAYDQISFLDRWVLRKIPGMANSVESSLDEFSGIETSLQDALHKQQIQPKFTLDENFILGNVMDFVTMLQLDSLFEWSYPQLKRTFPSQDSIKSRNHDNRKGTPEYYNPAIESYRVEISTHSSEDEGQLKSYGISDMIQLGFLLDKPFVNVEVVEYDRGSEQWRWVINFNRKTSEYTRLFEEEQGS